MKIEAVKTDFIAQAAKALSEGKEIEIFTRKYLPTNTVDIVVRVSKRRDSLTLERAAQCTIKAEDLYRFGLDGAWTGALITASEKVDLLP